MEIVEKEGGLHLLDTDILKTFLCQLLKLPPGSRVKLAQIYPSRKGQKRRSVYLRKTGSALTIPVNERGIKYGRLVV